MARTSKINWLELIQTCRTSGLSDYQWCKEQNIAYSTFYYNLRKLQDEACELPSSSRTCRIPMPQEVVQLNFDSLERSSYNSEMLSDYASPAITLQLPNATLQISNLANATVIHNTIQALQQLC